MFIILCNLNCLFKGYINFEDRAFTCKFGLVVGSNSICSSAFFRVFAEQHLPKEKGKVFGRGRGSKSSAEASVWLRRTKVSINITCIKATIPRNSTSGALEWSWWLCHFYYFNWNIIALNVVLISTLQHQDF